MPTRKTLDQIKKEFNDLVGNEYQILSNEYFNNKKKLKILHTSCGNEFEMSADGFLNRGNRCKYCANQMSWSYTTEEFKKMVSESLLGDEYEVLSKYENTHTPVLMKHKTCGNTFEMRPNNFLIKGNRCPVCSTSNGENRIEDYLKKSDKKYVQHAKIQKLSNRMTFDFKIFLNEKEFFLVEFDGRFHYEPYSLKEEHVKKFESQKKNDEMKNEFCKKNNIDLLRISYKEIDNIEKILEKKFNDYSERKYTQVSGNAEHLPRDGDIV